MKIKSKTITPKIAFVYDRVNTKFGGAEHVLEQIHLLYPDAPLFTSVYDANRANWASVFQVRTSFLQKLPFFRRFHRLLVGLMPLAFETLQLNEFDIVISITSAEAKGVLTSTNQLHICYLLTPTRYLWSHTEEYQNDFFTGWLREIVFKYLRWWDTVAAFRPDVIVPISKLVQNRTQVFYGRKTLPVIYPPVQLNNLQSTLPLSNPSDEPFFLIISRLVSYKRIDIAIQACQKLKQKLIIIGDGPDKIRLKKLVDKNAAKIIFLSAVQPDQIAAYYQNCIAFLAPGEEDFGIATIESLQAGKPAIVYFNSGSAELIQNKKTGIYLMNQSVSDLVDCMKQVENVTWDSAEIQQSVAGQSAVQFQSQFKSMVEEQWQLFEKGHYE